MTAPVSILTERWQIRGRQPLRQRITASHLLVGSFAVLILLGTLGLRFLPGLYTGDRLGWLDCLFTATSAVCVTGLVVVDTATYFTFWGQAFILLLFQLGGLGIITFTSLIIVALGRRISLRQEMTTSTRDIAPAVDPKRLIRDIFVFTFALEGFGAIVLYLSWGPLFGWGPAAWHAVFHSVSAFCNAGFSTFSDSLMRFQEHRLSLGVITILVIGGGLGFLTIEELWMRFRFWRTRRYFRVSLHSRLVILTTVGLLLVGTGVYLLLEWNNLLGPMTTVSKFENALFMAATSRTAGFNSVDYSQATDGTNFLTIILMYIGGAPGSTAGGIKVTTFALIVLIACSRLRGYNKVSLMNRSVPDETVQRAVGVAVVTAGLLTLAILVFCVTERIGGPSGNFLALFFEATSALGTVGLSMGTTPQLSPTGRLTAIVLMFLGRVGPMVFAAILTRRLTRSLREFRYSYEDVAVG